MVTNEYKRKRGQLIITTSIKPEDLLGSGAISSTRSPLNTAGKVPSYSKLPEPTPVPNPPSTVRAAESTEQLPESHAVNAAPVIPPTSTHKLPTPPTSVCVPSSIAGTTVAAEAAILSSQPANAVPSISATTDTPGAAQSSTTAPIHNPTSGEPPKNLATTTTIGVRTDEVGEESDAMNLMDINENSSSRRSTRNDNRNTLESIVKSELVRVMQQHEAIGRTERKVQDIGVWYPDEYVGLQRCHFRSLYCVCPEMAKKAFEQKIPHDQHEKLKELVANNAEGDIFWVRQQAWVSLTKTYFIEDKMCYDVINHSLAKFILDFSEFNFPYDTMVIEDNLKCKVPPLETATATSESSSAQPSSVLPPATSVSLPTASSTTGGASFDADTENPEHQRDKSDSEPGSDQGDDLPTREPKYKFGTFIRKEVDNIECTGFIHGYVLGEESFVYYVHMNEPDIEECITEEDISTFIFFSSEGWVVEKNLNVYVRVGKTDHPATIDSMVRLTEELVDTNSVRIKWSINNQSSVVDLSTVTPMHSSPRERQKRKKERKKLASVEEITTGIRSTPVTTPGQVQDSYCPRKLLVGLSYTCRHYINCNSRYSKQKTAKLFEKMNRLSEDMVTFRDNYRLYQQGRSIHSSASSQVTLTTGMELYNDTEIMDSVTKTCNGLEVKLSPKSSFTKCLCLMTHSCRIEESKPKREDDDLNKNMSEVPLVFGPLCSFMDRDDQVDLELSCLSNMSVTVVFVPDIGIHPVLLNFISQLFGLQKDQTDYKHAIFAVHGPSISDKTHLVNLLTTGYLDFIQVYDVMHGSIFKSDVDENMLDDSMDLACQEADTSFLDDGSLRTFLHNICVLIACTLQDRVVNKSMKSPYFKPVKKLLAEYLINRSSPENLNWLNVFLERIRSNIFSMDNLIVKIRDREGDEMFGLDIGSMLDNVFKLGAKDNRYKHHKEWASSNCCIETVCASAMVIYKHSEDGKYRFWCQCCKKSVHASTSGEYDSLHDAMVAIPYVSITHRLARRLKLYSSELVHVGSPLPEDYSFQGDFRLHAKHLKGMESDASVTECVPDSSKLDNVIGDDSILLSALKNDLGERSIGTARSWKSIVTFIFGTPDNEDDDETPLTKLKETRTPRQDHNNLQEKIKRVMDGEDVMTVFPISHNEKVLELRDIEGKDKDWKPELDHVEGLLASRATYVTKVNWKDPSFLRCMPCDIHHLFGEEDCNHLNNILQDDRNEINFFHQLGLLSAYLQVAPEGSDDAHIYRRIPKIARQFAVECSNGCENIFTKEGRKRKVKDSNVYVMTSVVTTSHYKKLQEISKFLKGEEFYDIVGDRSKAAKCIQWVANPTVQGFLEEDVKFFEGLGHNMQVALPDKVKSSLSNHFETLKQEYEAPNFFQLTVLHPYHAYLRIRPNGGFDNTCSYGFAETQVAMSISFLYGTIPFMKAMERMTNPCFQDKNFAKVMKGKHVEQDPDEFRVEFESAKTSEHARKTSRVRVLNNTQVFKPPEGCAPDYQYSPPVVNSSILFPIRVTRDKLNCAFGNTVNLLTYINHFNTDLKQTLLNLKARSGGCCLREIRNCIIDCGYDTFTLPSISTYSVLQTFVTESGIPMLVSLELNFRTFTYYHVIGISPFISSETSQVEYHIIDGAHPQMKAMKLSQENIDWCCGEEISFKKVACGFAFVPGKKRVLEMLTDKAGFNVVPGTSLCLTTTPKTSKRGGKNKTDITYERIFGQNNVIRKEKSEYVKIWNQLTEEYQNTKPAYRRRRKTKHNTD